MVDLGATFAIVQVSARLEHGNGAYGTYALKFYINNGISVKYNGDSKRII